MVFFVGIVGNIIGILLDVLLVWSVMMTGLDNIGIITIHIKVLVLVVKYWYLLLVLLAILLVLVCCHIKV